MKKNYTISGFAYRLRPVNIDDAQFIIDVRLEDAERNKFIHKISRDIDAQRMWISEYLNREGDYYFVIENRFTNEPEGLIAFYDEKDGKAEWGRWVIKKGSLASAESVYLLYKIAFEQHGLIELYCRTVANNLPVVAFHDAIGERRRCLHEKIFEIEGKYYDAVEQYANREVFYEEVAPVLIEKATKVSRRQLKKIMGEFTLDHIGVATRSIEKELPYYLIQGYDIESKYFIDKEQGVRGIFLSKDNEVRLELLENYEESETLTKHIDSGRKMYHRAYYVNNIDNAINVLKNNRARILSPLKKSEYFGKRICFLIFPNMDIVELLER